MAPYEERRLRSLLAALHDYGQVLRASFEPALPDYGFAEAVDYLRDSVGAHIVEAALAAGGRSLPGGEPAPAAVMPVWAFEPEGGSKDAPLSSARLWNTDLLVEALRVEDDDHPEPVPPRCASGSAAGPTPPPFIFWSGARPHVMAAAYPSHGGIGDIRQ